MSAQRPGLRSKGCPGGPARPHRGHIHGEASDLDGSVILFRRCDPLSGGTGDALTRALGHGVPGDRLGNTGLAR